MSVRQVLKEVAIVTPYAVFLVIVGAPWPYVILGLAIFFTMRALGVVLRRREDKWIADSSGDRSPDLACQRERASSG